jgi:MFS transporter, PPP family, 3-phenylpropionic acid transporter
MAWILALPQIARVAAPALWGWIADRSGTQRTIVVLGCLANAVCYALLPEVSGTAAMAWLVGTTALVSTAALPLVEAITLGALARQSGRYGPIRLWGSISFMAAVFAGGAGIDFSAPRALPYAMVGCALLAVAAALALPPARVHTAPPQPWRIRAPAGGLLACGFCMAVAHGALYAFLTLHLQALGYGGTAIGALWMLGVLAEIAVFLYLPQLFRRHALSTLLVASAACAVVRFLAIGWAAQWLALVVAAQVLHAATFGSFHAAAVASVARVFPPHAQAFGQTLFSSIGYGAGAAAGTLLAGWAWEASGAGLAFSLSAGAALAGLLFAYALKRAGL